VRLTDAGGILVAVSSFITLRTLGFGIAILDNFKLTPGTIGESFETKLEG